jgi:hypothetical protein
MLRSPEMMAMPVESLIILVVFCVNLEICLRMETGGTDGGGVGADDDAKSLYPMDQHLQGVNGF